MMDSQVLSHLLVPPVSHFSFRLGEWGRKDLSVLGDMSEGKTYRHPVLHFPTVTV